MPKPMPDWRMPTSFSLIENGSPRRKPSPRFATTRSGRSSLTRRWPSPMPSWQSLKEFVDWDWAGAEAEYRKAIGLNPNDATSHHWYAILLENLGRLNEALAENEKALALDPASPQINANHAGILIHMHRYDDALS